MGKGTHVIFVAMWDDELSLRQEASSLCHF